LYSVTVDKEWSELDSERRSVYRARPNAGTVTMNDNCSKQLHIIAVSTQHDDGTETVQCRWHHWGEL